MPTETRSPFKEQEIKSFVKDRYTQALSQPRSSCCGTNPPSAFANDARMIQSIGYTPEELKMIPEDAVANSFGCGNPLAWTGVKEGQVVVDIGSGAGIDCFIAAEKVGPTGKVIGVDMTPAMLERARANASKARLTNVEFRQGDADALPLETSTVDWVVSNCVINLAPDKTKVFREIARVLKPGGQISISDIVVGDLPWWVRRSRLFYSSCVAGALPEVDYLNAMRAAGLKDLQVTSRFSYDEAALSGFCSSDSAGAKAGAFSNRGFRARLEGWLLSKLLRWFSKPIARRMAGQVVSIKVAARKP